MMAVGSHSTRFKAVPGVRLGGGHCGIKRDGSLDLVIFELAPGSAVAGIFTRSHFAAAPVLVCRRHLEASGGRYFLINSGNANAATGEEGIRDAEACCDALSRHAGVSQEEILPFSTGVIGERLQVDRIVNALPGLLPALSEENWLQAAQGIMTTDTRPKICSRQLDVAGKAVTITGIAKGAGMIQPDMATLLAFVATDVQAAQGSLQAALGKAADQSFNRITVEGDTSTNDSCMLAATGASGVALADCSGLFEDALASLMTELAQGIVKDAEGATKFVTVRVKGGDGPETCLEVARAIANSPLVKTAIFASDANWGRVAMAIGKARARLDPRKVDCHIGDVCVMKGGRRSPGYREEMGAAEMAKDEIVITVDLNLGAAEETVWTSDLSHEYVSVNADYRT